MRPSFGCPLQHLDAFTRQRGAGSATRSAITPVGLAWVTVLAFVRIMTSPRIFRRPLTIAEATQVVDAWLEVPGLTIVGPGERHWEVLRQALVDGQAVGPLASHAHLAALAIEHGATLATTDRDFARFPVLKIVNPLES